MQRSIIVIIQASYRSNSGEKEGRESKLKSNLTGNSKIYLKVHTYT